MGLRSCSWGCHPEPWTQHCWRVSAGVSVGSDSESTPASQEHMALSLPTQDSPLLSSPPLCAPSPRCPQTPSSPAGREAPPSPGACLQLVGAAARPDSGREGGRPPLSGGLTLPPGVFLFPSIFPCGQIRSSQRQRGWAQTPRE